MPDISVIMPCHNRAYDLRRVLEAYDHQQGGVKFELIAIDDGSTDTTFEVLSEYIPQNYTLLPIRQAQNRGPAAARNAGIRKASSELLLFVGDDIVPDAYLVSGHLAAHRFDQRKDTAILGRITWPDDLPVNTVMRHIEGIGAQQFSYYYLKNGHEYDFRHFYTANISIYREILDSQQSWFDEDFPYAVFEDIELSYRLSVAGMRIVYIDSIVGYHYHYHNVWTYSRRHEKAGQMACLVVKKQPPTGRYLLGRNWRSRLRTLRILAALNPSPKYNPDVLEDKVLHAASRFEWTSHPLLDRFYLQLFLYFYYKGMIFGMAKSQVEADKLSRIHAGRTLPKLISQVSRWV